jgi:hypothetical protein
MGEFQIKVASATQASYSKWASMTATTTAVTGTASATSTYSSTAVPTATSYDYIVVGGGVRIISLALTLHCLAEFMRDDLALVDVPALSGTVALTD